MAFKIAVISDIHYSEDDQIWERKASIADILLLRAVHRINNTIKPDVTVLLGDILDDGDAPNAPELRKRLADILDILESPVIIIPGNHDDDVDAFYKDFPRTPDVVDIKGHRLVQFLDPDEPDWNARRTEADIERMKSVRGDFDGPVIMLQHTSLYPPGMSDCPYNYTNIDRVMELMKSEGIRLAISGHFHRGEDLIRHNSGDFVIAPALCEEPFNFLEITLDDGDVSVKRHALQMPRNLGLIDYHVHTPFAYCSENMNMSTTLSLAEYFGLAGFVFLEHSGHLYFRRKDYLSQDFLLKGIDSAVESDSRMDDYLNQVRAFSPPAMIGLEVDADSFGRPVVHKGDAGRVDMIMGAVHGLLELRKKPADLNKAGDEFLAQAEGLMRSGVPILAHPFRVFRRSGQPVPTWLFEPMVRLLKEHNVAAEINYHTNEPPVEFFTMCINAGVKLAFGSDAHNLYEVGEFSYHLQFLQDCGFDGDLGDVLIARESVTGR